MELIIGSIIFVAFIWIKYKMAKNIEKQSEDYTRMHLRETKKTYDPNQCQGCQAGWKLYNKIHAVRGGYPGEMVACSKDKYEN